MITQDLLAPAYCLSFCQLSVSSQKRLFEIVATEMSLNLDSLQAGDLLQQLLAREKLGSTALGQGVAIPHCRTSNCDQPIGCVVTLSEAIEFNAPDDQPVDIVFFLVVPSAASEAHLQLLARLARLFSDTKRCADLRRTQSEEELKQCILQSLQHG